MVQSVCLGCGSPSVYALVLLHTFVRQVRVADQCASFATASTSLKLQLVFGAKTKRQNVADMGDNE